MYTLSADVGGTFTDVVLINSANGQSWADKVLTTPGRSQAIVEGIQRLSGLAGIDPSDIGLFVHGFTIATNAWLTRNGAKVALAVTDGFRDMLAIGTQRRMRPYSLLESRPAPLVPRDQIVEIKGRIDAFGSEVVPFSKEDAAHAAEELLDLEPEAVAISLLFGHLTISHEVKLAEALAARAPDLPVYCSHEINPQIEEYPRTNTAVTAAYVGPAVDDYISELESALPKIGLTAPVLLMRSDGGVSTITAARENPATMLLSGPAGGVVAGCEMSKDLSVPDIITFDMGGTSADFSLITGGQAVTATERVINGEILRLSTLDIPTISAGGGSIARVDAGGAIRVGPQSAGSVPGPACYGRGGTLPTLTDAALVLGLLGETDFLGGEMRLNFKAAFDAITDQIAEPLGISAEEAAFAMVTIANAGMGQCIRALAVERGQDLRNFSLLAFGGAGPIFAPFLATDLDMREVLVPPRPGVFSASGLQLTDIRYALQAPFLSLLAEAKPENVLAAYHQLEQQAEQAFERDRVDKANRQIVWSVDLRYEGQVHELTLPLTSLDAWNVDALTAAFSKAHELAYGFADETIPCELVNLRLDGIGLVPRPMKSRPCSTTSNADAKHRPVYFGPKLGTQKTAVMHRASFAPADKIEGPSIINQPDTTTVVLPNQTALVAADGTLRIIANRENNRG